MTDEPNDKPTHDLPMAQREPCEVDEHSNPVNHRRGGKHSRNGDAGDGRGVRRAGAQSPSIRSRKGLSITEWVSM